MAVIAAMSIATAFAREQQADSCKQSELNFVNQQDYEDLLFSQHYYSFLPSQNAEVKIHGGSLMLKTDSGHKKLKGEVYGGEYVGFYTYVGYISVSEMYVCEEYQLHDHSVLLVNRKSGDITRLYSFASFNSNGTMVVTYDMGRDGILGGVIKVYDYIDGEYTCVKEIRDESWYPVEAYFYYDEKVIGKVRYYDDNRVGYFWIPA